MILRGATPTESARSAPPPARRAATTAGDGHHRLERFPLTDDPTRIPVIIGVGQINDRPDSGEDGLDSLQLMAAAARAADADAGGRWLARSDRVAIVPQISFRSRSRRP